VHVRDQQVFFISIGAMDVFGTSETLLIIFSFIFLPNLVAGKMLLRAV